jgi:hypothetical protein
MAAEICADMMIVEFVAVRRRLRGSGFSLKSSGAIGNGKVVSGTGMGEDLEIGSLGDGKPGEFKAATS